MTQTGNGVVTWKWLAGMVLAIITGSGSVWVKVHTDVARVEERIKALEQQMAFERIAANRLDTDVRRAQQQLIELAAAVKAHHKGD
jgi:uncharacterized membrane protein YciS (DUF1049 family)